MYTSSALRHELATKGNQLLRAVVHTFYSPIDSIVIGGLTELSPDNRTVKQDELAAYLHLNNEFVSIRLRPFVNDKFISEEFSENKLPYTQVYYGGSTPLDREDALSLIVDVFLRVGEKNPDSNGVKIGNEEYNRNQLLDKPLDWLVTRLPNTTSSKFPGRDKTPPSIHYTYRENDKTVFIAKVSEGKRKQKIVKYVINYENMVYSIKYKIVQIQLQYDRRSDPSYYYCPDNTCVHYDSFIEAKDLYMASHTNGTISNFGAFNQTRPRLGGGLQLASGNQFVKLNNNNANPIMSNSTQTNVSTSLQTLHSTPQVSLNGAVKRQLGDGFTNGGGNATPQRSHISNTSYPCPRCQTTLIACGGREVQDEKRQFLAYTNQINELTQSVFHVLKQLREYERKLLIQQLQLDGGVNINGAPAGPKQGVGAKGGCSTEADLASRIENFKNPLPWDELSLADYDRLLAAQAKQKQIEEQIARQMKLQEEEAEREKQHQNYLAEQEKRKRATALKRAIFGNEGLADDPDGVLLSQFGGNVLELQEYKLKQAQMAKVDALAQYQQVYNPNHGFDSDGNIIKQNVEQEEEDNSSFWVNVKGVKVRLEDITEVHLDLMTQDEFDKYQGLMEMELI